MPSIIIRIVGAEPRSHTGARKWGWKKDLEGNVIRLILRHDVLILTTTKKEPVYHAQKSQIMISILVERKRRRTGPWKLKRRQSKRETLPVWTSCLSFTQLTI
jgi:hypothetical protein